ncbi:MAG: hypothetical protein JSR82_04175 [Verrucomicrobia bacterium]|nr:hypothetical protein [Verrucomicrobiota bacterium]
MHFGIRDRLRDGEVRALSRALRIEEQIRWEGERDGWDAALDTLLVPGRSFPCIDPLLSALGRGVPVVTDIDAELQAACGGALRQLDARRPDLLAALLWALQEGRGVSTSPSEQAEAAAQKLAIRLEEAARSEHAVACPVSATIHKTAARARPSVSVMLHHRGEQRSTPAVLDRLCHEVTSADAELLIFEEAVDSPMTEPPAGGQLRRFSPRDFPGQNGLGPWFDQAGGAILVYLEAGDLLLAGALRHVIGHFRDHPRTQVVYGRALKLAGQNATGEEFPTEPWDWWRLLETNFLCRPSVFWRREVMQRFGNFDESLRYAMDYEYWLRVGRRESFEYLHGLPPLAGQRIRGGGTASIAGRVEFLREALSVVHRYAPDPAPVHRSLEYFAQCLTQSEFPQVRDRRQRRQFARRWAAHVLIEAAALGIPVDASLAARLEQRLRANHAW